ncbi:MAG: hypothetical protein CL610_17415 [Anaerolineaceae bacterium]|nr:hypothetical protein [Anaerolineaceae bacterium]
MTEDTYWPTPRGTYEERRQLYLDYCAVQSPGGRTGFFSQIARLELGQAVDERPFREALDYLYSNSDCNDFTMGGLLRILYQYRESPHISRELIADIEKAVLWFKYWWDEPNPDKRCYWTENHQIIFHADELLAGQLFPDAIFENDGKDGQYHIDHALHYIRRWLDFRIRFGISEWLSNNYFEEDLLALVNLHDFAQQPDIRHQAKLLIDTLMFEMALHTYRGVMGCSHGRTYPRLIKGARGEDASNTAKLMFGMGMYNSPNMMGTMVLATSAYRCPEVIVQIAADLDTPRLFRERHSLNIDDAYLYGLSYDNLDDCHLYWSIQDFLHPTIVNLSERLGKTYHIRQHEDFQGNFKKLFQGQIDQHGRIINPHMDCHAMTEVHIQTYRTGDYLLSSAQDYRSGSPGYQQHPWQATLGIDAMVFTNHPGADDEHSRPNFWAGNSILPRVVQKENVLVALHRIPHDDPFPFSHAYFPKAAFDDIVERGGWVFGRKDDGYIAIYAGPDYQWLADRHDEAHPINELRASSPHHAWVVEMGRAAQWGTFAAFVDAIARASLTIRVDDLNIHYDSPSQGPIEFSWDGLLWIMGREVLLHNYPRFDNPYCQAEFGARQYTIQHGDRLHTLDFDAGVLVEST